jgi:hypothetical protein
MMLIICALVITSASSASSPIQFYRTISTTSPRPMGMGGAFVSVRGQLAALHWNPAAFTLYEDETSQQISVHINPVITGLLLYENHQDVADYLAALGTALRGVTYSHRWAELGLLLWEEPLYNPMASANGPFFDASHILKHYVHTFGLRVRLAPTVSLGSTGNLYDIRNEQGKSTLAGGANYGVLLQPAKGLEIGLAYFDLPSGITTLRQNMEGIADESVNGGFSLQPDDKTILTVDVRNISGQETIGWDRVRFGFERTFWKLLALRFGYFQTQTQEHDVYSFGLGLFGSARPGRGTAVTGLGRYLANYALLVEKRAPDRQLWHLLSVMVNI